MRRLVIRALPGVNALTRIALLPGAYQGPEDFVREGFVTVLRARQLSVDLEFIAPQLQHVTDRSVLDAIRREVVDPARAAGCQRVWLGGVSLGGFLSLAYAAAHRGTVDGLCLFAPYLGNRSMTQEIARAGGVANWQPTAASDSSGPSAPVVTNDEERRVWQYIQELQRQDPPMRDLPVCLGLARQDRFAPSHQLLAEALPAQAVYSVDGGHDWPAWRAMWQAFLDRNF